MLTQLKVSIPLIGSNLFKFGMQINDLKVTEVSIPLIGSNLFKYCSGG